MYLFLAGWSQVSNSKIDRLRLVKYVLELTAHMAVFIRRVLPILETVLLEGMSGELRGREREAHTRRALRRSARSGAADIVARYCR